MTLGIEVVETSSLGDRTYLIHDGEVAAVIDPQRDIDRVLAVAGRLGVRITHVAETHLHNDYVSGGLALARLTGASYLVAAAEHVSFARTPVADGDQIRLSDMPLPKPGLTVGMPLPKPGLTVGMPLPKPGLTVGGVSLTAVATPGHTYNHLSYVVSEGDRPAGVCTGGSLLFGTTGRTDLLGPEHTHTLAHEQHASARRLADLLPDGAAVWPTHGFGSFCSATPTDADESTIGREKRSNPVLRLQPADFVSLLLAGLGAYPAYYAHMGARNASGADLIDLTPPGRADPAALAARIEAGEWVVDLRTRKAFAYRHLIGTLSFGVDGSLATWLGWALPAGAPLTLLGESAQQIATAQRELARIGIDRPAAAATGTPEDWAATPAQLTESRTATFADLAAASADVVVIDVRAENEWREGHIEGALHIPLPEIESRVASLPEGEIWVHCAAGYRAAAAASLLARAGRPAIPIDDDWPNAAAADLRISTPQT